MTSCAICHEQFRIGDQHTSRQIGMEVVVVHQRCADFAAEQALAEAIRSTPIDATSIEGHRVLDDESLAQWWSRVSQDDLSAAVPKAEEYGGTHNGSADLKIMGYALMQLRIPEDAPEEVGQIAACWLYELGKVARGITNLNKGEPIKQDHMHDGRVYWMMMQRLAETGRWP